MADYRDFAQYYYTRETLLKAESIIERALSKIEGPIGSLALEKLTQAERMRCSRELAKRLDLPKSLPLQLIEQVIRRRMTRAVLAVFTGKRTLEEAAAEGRISPSDVAETLEIRTPELERIFGSQGRALSIEELHSVMEGIVEQSSGATMDKTVIAKFKVTTRGESSQSAGSPALKPPSPENSTKRRV
jgi:hypothetical protein